MSSTVTVNRPTVKTFPMKVFGSLLDWSALALDLENSLFILKIEIKTQYKNLPKSVPHPKKYNLTIINT